MIGNIKGVKVRKSDMVTILIINKHMAIGVGDMVEEKVDTVLEEMTG